MALNIFPRRKEPEAAPFEPEITLPEPPEAAVETLDGADETRRRSRRGSRGGRGRRRPGTAETAEIADETIEAAEANQPEVEPEPKVRAPRGRRATAKKEPAEETPLEVAAEATPAEPEPVPAKQARRRTPKAAEPSPDGTEEPASQQAILRALDQQNRQIEHLIRLQEDAARRYTNGVSVAAPPARVGVFVDAANIELACDRLRARIDWGKVMRILTDGRQLVRAMAYSPVHDDPGVSIETQRFVEPFLDKGFKVVTKPLKRFQDGTIKANVDIELALDVITMLDRLDIVCLVSGDGDFQRLVEVVQSRGVRCEVVAMANSTATNLRHAADAFIDLQARMREVRA